MRKSLDFRRLYFKLFIRVSLGSLNRKFSATFLIVKISLIPLFVPLLFIACKTPTVESRKQERLAAYNALPDDQRQMVDKGQIKIGMNEDAVYIAWGPPSQILQSETESGHTTIWMYHGTTMEETRSGLIARWPAMAQPFWSATWIGIIIHANTSTPKFSFKTVK